MKRLTGLLLAVTVFVSLLTMITVPAAAAEPMKASDAMIEIMKAEEGFCQYPKYDYGQYTVGYGSRCPSDMLAYYQKNGITEAEAELLLRNYLNNTEVAVNKYLIEQRGLKLTQGQFDALVSFSYNMGTGWLRESPESSNIMKQVVTGATGNDLINAFARWCNASGKILTGLLRRRLSEANMYLNEEYAQKPPSNYCYTYFNGNGGSTNQGVQGYDSNLTADILAKATYGDYTFLGWFTAAVGGTQVTKLDASTNKKTLYAQWKEINESNQEELESAVEVTVTVDSLNLRNGPGTNYSIVSSASRNDKLSITQTTTVAGQLWGKHGDAWACLVYTDYEEVIASQPEEPEATEPEVTEPQPTEPEATEPQPTEPEATEPQPTEPEVTEPQPTEPEVTEPQPTEPEATEPQPTEPEVTEPQPTEPEATQPPAAPKTVKGTVVSNDPLNVRTGPGTAYSVVKTIRSGTVVEILEQKTAGSMIWGKIADGWVSMTYIKLEKTETAEPVVPPANTTTPSNPNTASLTGTVTCASLNVRSGPGVNYSVVSKYSKGNTVTITDQKVVKSTTWGKTANGWVSMEYIKLTTSSGTTTQPEASPKQTGKVNSDDVLRVRSGAGTSYAIVDYLKPGATVTVTETKKVGATTWGKVEKGWVSMDYIQLDKKEPEPSAPEQTTSRTGKVVADDVLRVRSGAGTSYGVVDFLNPGATVTVTETKEVNGTTWGKVGKGWISLDYVELEPLKDEAGRPIYVVSKTVCTSMLNVRSGPGTTYEICGYYYEGAKVEITEIKTVNEKAWGKTEKGWISMAYVE